MPEQLALFSDLKHDSSYPTELPSDVEPTLDETDPEHYNCWTIEPIDFILKNGLGFCEGNIIKYVMRWEMKNGVVDLKKARKYIEFLIEQEEGKR